MKKINAKGQYQRFRGLTVVSHVQPADNDFWNEIYDALSSSDLIKKYFSPLPAESFHATMINLFTEEEHGDNWEGFVKSKLPFFKRLHKSLEENSFTPKISFKYLIDAGVIQLVVILSPEQETQVRELAQKFQVEEKVPPYFHITLAYQYRPFENNDIRVVTAEISAAINPLVNQRHTLSLLPPQLCYFNDMTKFKPWEGKEYPFDNTGSESGFFADSRKASSENSDDKGSDCCIQ